MQSIQTLTEDLEASEAPVSDADRALSDLKILFDKRLEIIKITEDKHQGNNFSFVHVYGKALDKRGRPRKALEALSSVAGVGWSQRESWERPGEVEVRMTFYRMSIPEVAITAKQAAEKIGLEKASRELDKILRKAQDN